MPLHSVCPTVEGMGAEAWDKDGFELQREDFGFYWPHPDLSTIGTPSTLYRSEELLLLVLYFYAWSSSGPYLLMHQN